MIDIIQESWKVSSRRMGAKKTGPNSPVAQRIKRLRKAYSINTTTALAKMLDVSLQRISNVENGSPLSRDLAFKIVQRFQGITTDWLWHGSTAGLSVQVATLLGEFEHPPEQATKTGR